MADSGVLKILYVLDILKRTDEFHPINSTQIIEALAKEGLSAERKAVGKYIKALTEEMGYDIVLCENKNLGWYMRDQVFEDYELKMLVDAVAATKCLTVSNSRNLIRKICGIATKEGNRIIKSTMVMDDTLKLVDAKFAVKFDTVMRAIADHKQIRFQYEEVTAGNKKVAKRGGEFYQISPYYLGVWKEEYFVVANTAPYTNTSHYRIEMMKNLEVTNEPARPMSEVDELKGIGQNGRTFGDYIKETINLRSGIVKDIKISGINHLRREVMKKFGNAISFHDQGNERFSVYVNVADSEGFYQWMAQFGCNMKIEGPAECVDRYKKFLQETLMQYE